MRMLMTMLACLALAPVALAEDAMPHRTSKPNLTILVDDDLILPTAALARSYAKTSHTPLTTVVRNPNTENEIGQGLEAHLIMSADKELIERLAAQGLTDVSSIHAFAQTARETRTGKMLEELTNTKSASPKQHYVAVLASESMEDARAFATFLDSKQAQDMLEKAGLERPAKD